jgi:AraC-like DNA-binding protein
MGADLLGETLAAFKFKEFNIADFQLGAPWAISTKGFPPGVNLIVVEGACWFRLPDGRDVRLRAGQSVLVPRGGDLIFASDLELRAALVTEVWEEEQLRELSEEPATLHERHWGGDGDLCRILGFAFELEETAEEQLLPHLPETIIVDNTVPTQRLARHLREFFATSAVLEPGEVATRTRFAEGLVIDQLRRYTLSTEHEAGWLAGIGHRKLQKAMALIHMRYDEPWSTQALAKECGMSRASFAKHFNDILGQPPAEYLNDWRVRKARHLLAATRLPLSEIAFRVGFSSEIAFRRNVRRVLGKSPRDIRKSGSAPIE